MKLVFILTTVLYLLLCDDLYSQAQNAVTFGSSNTGASTIASNMSTFSLDAQSVLGVYLNPDASTKIFKKKAGLLLLMTHPCVTVL